MSSSYEERNGAGTALLHKDYTWAQDAAGNVYVGSVATTQNPGASQVQSKSTQTLDVYSNTTQSQVYDYGNLTTAARTYLSTFVTDANYTTRYIRNRLLTATVTPAGGPAATLANNYYDVYSGGACMGGGLTARNGAPLHGLSWNYLIRVGRQCLRVGRLMIYKLSKAITDPIKWAKETEEARMAFADMQGAIGRPEAK